ncbi:MAG: lipoyl synthase [Armatimonadota bacterium]
METGRSPDALRRKLQVRTLRPSWLRARAPSGAGYEEVSRLVESSRLHTVCRSAHCPNIGECWGARTAAFMILGSTCTRNCRFCAVDKLSTGKSDLGRCLPVPDPDEPRRVAEAVAYLGLRHAVITSVTRDDVPDGGASVFAETIKCIHQFVPGCSVEVLVPDFRGDWNALDVVLDAGPDVLNHNIETVERLYPAIRPQAVYERSLELLRRASERRTFRKSPGRDCALRTTDARTKSGLMVGVGETWAEVIKAMRDLRDVGCDILTIGQYLAPSSKHVPVARYYTPEEFAELKRIGLEMRFEHVESGPLVRSSYHAAEAVGV